MSRHSDDGNLVVTVDVEFFDTPFLFRDRAGAAPSAVENCGREGVWFVADLLERHGIRGTFFILGEIGEEDPELVAELADRGHEIASHGYSKSHPDLRECSDDRVSKELTKSKSILEDIIGDSIEGFRAPAFSMDDSVMREVATAEYHYDSSVVPGIPISGFYGTPGAPLGSFASEEWFGTEGVTEFPVAVEPRFRLPLSGAWMRLLGRKYTLWGTKRHLRQNGTTVIYIHPWELVDLPRYDVIPKRVYWRTGQYTRETLEQLVSAHSESGTTLKQVVDEQ